MNFLPISIDAFEVETNPFDLLHDLHQYLMYMQSHEVKRKTRSNELPNPDIRRLLKSFSNPELLLEEFKLYKDCTWLNFIDTLALSLELVDFDIQGEYRGYTSQSPSFIDNYILTDPESVESFNSAPPSEQMTQILNDLINRKHTGYDNPFLINEFLHKSILGRLDPFSNWGISTGQMPNLNMPEARLFLIKLLKDCQPGAWYSVKDLIAHLKDQHPDFLFPSEPSPDRWGEIPERYQGFSEGPLYSSNNNCISEDDPNAFERVEGRFVERFLEGIPLLIGGVNLAYDPLNMDEAVFPSINHLTAFQVRSWLSRLLNHEALPAKVTVLPNFEILLESEYYHQQLVHQISAFAHPIKESLGETGACLFTFSLSKETVAEALVEEPDLDVLALLEGISSTPIPANVAVEINEARRHADVFKLYRNYSLVESDHLPPEIETFTSVHISPQMKLIEQPIEAFQTLEALERVPVWVEHKDDHFSPIPEGALSLFPKVQPPQTTTPPAPEPITIEKEITITLRFPSEAVFKVFKQALVEKRIPTTIEEEALALIIPERYQAEIDTIIQQNAETYQIKFKTHQT